MSNPKKTVGFQRSYAVDQYSTLFYVFNLVLFENALTWKYSSSSSCSSYTTIMVRLSDVFPATSVHRQIVENRSDPGFELWSWNWFPHYRSFTWSYRLTREQLNGLFLLGLGISPTFLDFLDYLWNSIQPCPSSLFFRIHRSHGFASRRGPSRYFSIANKIRLLRYKNAWINLTAVRPGLYPGRYDHKNTLIQNRNEKCTVHSDFETILKTKSHFHEKKQRGLSRALNIGFPIDISASILLRVLPFLR